MHDPSSAYLVGFFSRITETVDWILLFLSLLWLVLMFEKSRFPAFRERLPRILIPVYLTAFLTLILKVFVSDGWPGPLIIFSNEFYLPFPLHSFPSGHAGRAFALATALSAVSSRWRAHVFMIATLIALSRLFVGGHDMADIIGGACLGILVSVSYQQWFAKEAKVRTA